MTPHNGHWLKGRSRVLGVPCSCQALPFSFINDSDITFLCLPDAAAIEAADMAKDDVVIIDTSTAHRTDAGWAYGFPELSGEHRKAIRNCKQIAVPGCYASGFIAIGYPPESPQVVVAA